MVNKSPDKVTKYVSKSILDYSNIDEKYLCSLVKDGNQMNLSLHPISFVWWYLTQLWALISTNIHNVNFGRVFPV